MKKVITPQNILDKKQNGEKIIALTAYDYWSTLILNEVGIDIILVGDSLGMVMLGYDTTLPVTMDEMIHHTKAVTRANTTSLIVGDMPFMADSISVEKAMENAGKFIKEGGTGAIKIEGGKKISHLIQKLVDSGIPVLGHIGFTPQDILVIGGYKKARNKEEIIEDALALQDAGVFGVILECIPKEIAKEVTDTLRVPTIGIGSGPHCDGQILVLHDLLGFYPEIRPKFVKSYANLKEEIKSAILKWKNDILKNNI